MVTLPSTAREPARSARGFTLIELMVVVAIIGVLAAIAVPIYGKIQERAQIAKMLGDMRAIASALQAYRADCGVYPGVGGNTCYADGGGIDALVYQSINRATGGTVGPFFRKLPTPPEGWVGYRIDVSDTGRFRVYAIPTDGQNGGNELSVP